jgi:hypothetical protein
MAHAIRWLAQTASGFDLRSCARVRLQLGYVLLPPRRLVLQSLPAKTRVSQYKQLGASINRAPPQMAGGLKSLKPPFEVRTQPIRPGERVDEVKGTYPPLIMLTRFKDRRKHPRSVIHTLTGQLSLDERAFRYSSGKYIPD